MKSLVGERKKLKQGYLISFPLSLILVEVARECTNAGCENNIAHPEPIHSWKSIKPFVVSALKLGAVFPSRNPCLTSDIAELLIEGEVKRERCESEVVMRDGRVRRHKTSFLLKKLLRTPSNFI